MTAQFSHFVWLNGAGRAYDDIQVNLSSAKVPPSSAPTWRTYNYGVGGGVSFYVLGFDVNDTIDFTVQTNHSMELNTVLDNHIHFILPNTTSIGDKFQFQIDVVAAGIDTVYAVPAGSPYTAEYTVQANDNTTHRLLEIADIAASNDTVSTIYKCKLTRIAATSNEYGSEVYVDYSDCHYIKDSMGSVNEDSKT